jgi:hypothetical protein
MPVSMTAGTGVEGTLLRSMHWTNPAYDSVAQMMWQSQGGCGDMVSMMMRSPIGPQEHALPISRHKRMESPHLGGSVSETHSLTI